MSWGGRLSSVGKRYFGITLRRVLNVFVKSPILDSQPLPGIPIRSLRTRCFIGEIDNSCGITVLQKEDGAVEWIRTTTVLLPPAPQAGASASSATTAHAYLYCAIPIISAFHFRVNINRCPRFPHNRP